MNDAITPMMRQYQESKAKHPSAILLFRMGDFYEMFFDDAKKASKILDIALTTRDKNKENSVPMCGFPHHSAPAYISKLLSAGERVAVCDQMEDPRKAKGIVKREVTRVLTPGLTEEAGTLKSEENHYVAAIAIKGKDHGLAAFDLSTGDFRITYTENFRDALLEILRLNPKEVLIPESLPDDNPIKKQISEEFYIHEVEDWMAEFKSCLEILREQFQVHSVEGFGLTETVMVIAAGTILNYVRESRMEMPAHIKSPSTYQLGHFMVLDQITLKNLELLKNLKDGSTTGTLIGLLDNTCTPMGARLLRKWMCYPLLDPIEIRKRNGSVAAIAEDNIERSEIRSILRNVGDMERISGKIALRSVSPRDLVQLRGSIELLPSLMTKLRSLAHEYLKELSESDDLSYVAHAIATVIVDTPPHNVRDGGVIRDGYNAELDELRNVKLHGKEWIARIEAEEREHTGIQNLKVSYNKVFGYYIEISRSRLEKVPTHYIRKQTLVNAERFVTEELKNYEEKVLNAQERILEIEAEIFDLLRTKLLEVIPRIQETASKVAVIDVLASLAETAVKRLYVRPDVTESDELLILEGRHPVVETGNMPEAYVPNDVKLNCSTDQILIITGPNMAGKSTYMRQIALITIMAQMGGFVSASQASIGLVDRIFTRIGASDYLAFGQSTFMVEMNETADILHNSTRRSLVLLDEVGRGTSTFDGLSIAWAVTEYLHDHPKGGPRTLFATHYHELVDIALVKDRVKNFTIAVREWNDKIVFLRKIIPGGTNRSYGIQVAKLAGIPEQVIHRAKEILSNLEKEEIDPKGRPRISRKKEKLQSDPGIHQIELFGNPSDEILKELSALDTNDITPLEALNLISVWQKKIL